MTATSMKASDFKTHCLQVMDEVARTGQPVTITRHGKPVCMAGKAGFGCRMRGYSRRYDP